MRKQIVRVELYERLNRAPFELLYVEVEVFYVKLEIYVRSLSHSFLKRSAFCIYFFVRN